ncbi:hypothetical protein QQX98_005688 [Neonectria punicea]|uniref:Uncharacterized protein n=1 Tax=Neonectria punicea TaxID=979145 RepID=A0ABR1H3P5_9HYPO
MSYSTCTTADVKGANFKLVLVDVEILITNYGEIQAEAHGAVYLPSPLTTIYVDVKTPTVTSQGEHWLTVDETRAVAVTLQNILTGLHLGTYDDLPIVGQVLLTELRSLSAVTSPSVASKPLTFYAFFVKLYHPKITVNRLEFKDVEFMFDMRWVVGEDGKRVRQKHISLSAYMLGAGDLQASIVYDGVKNTLVAALLPVRPVTIGQMLSVCLPAAFPGLSMIKPVVDTLWLKGSSIGFKTKDGLDIIHFDFHVADDLIHFEQGKPVVSVVRFTRKVLNALSTGDELVAMEKQSGNAKMTEIYGDLIKPSPAADEQPGSWPEDWDDFEVEEAYMSYNRAEASVAVEDRQYPPGFSLYGLFRVFELPISVSMQIMPKRKGLVLRGSYADELDLSLIKLTSYPKKNISRPTLSLNTTDGTKYGVESGIQLLEFNKIYFKLDYKSAASKADRKLKGMAEYGGTILSYPNPTINFWYADGRWGFTGWKIRRTAYWDSGEVDAAPPSISDQLDNVALNIDKAIRKASESDGKCGPLVDFAINELHARHARHAAEGHSRAQGECGAPGHQGLPLPLPVDWLYSVKIKGTDIGTNIKLTQFEFVLPYDGFEPTSTGILKYLWEKVLNEENLEEIGRKMLDPKTLGKLVGVLAINVLAPEIIKKLICREPKGDDTKKLRDKEGQERPRGGDQ